MRLIRVPTLAATAVPLIIGGSVGVVEGNFSTMLWIDIFIVALLIQIGTNIFNEHGDFRRKIDTEPSVGFAGLIVKGESSAKKVLAVAITCYSIASILGILLVLFRGVLLLVFGIVALLMGILYSEGPLPISSTPFGELLVAAIMGPIEVISANLAATGQISSLSYVFSIPVSLTVAAILLANNIRDLEKDRNHGRKTLPVVIGLRYGSFLLLLLLVLPFLWSVPAFIIFPTSASIFLVWLAFPLALRSYLSITKKTNGWSGAVPAVAKLHLLVGAMLAISILTIHLF